MAADRGSAESRSEIGRNWLGIMVGNDDLRPTERQLLALRDEHRDLDAAIAALGARTPIDSLQLQRLKKRKLVLRDLIARLESALRPDIIA